MFASFRYCCQIPIGIVGYRSITSNNVRPKISIIRQRPKTFETVPSRSRTFKIVRGRSLSVHNVAYRSISLDTFRYQRYRLFILLVVPSHFSLFPVFHPQFINTVLHLLSPFPHTPDRGHRISRTSPPRLPPHPPRGHALLCFIVPHALCTFCD